MTMEGFHEAAEEYQRMVSDGLEEAEQEVSPRDKMFANLWVNHSAAHKVLDDAGVPGHVASADDGWAPVHTLAERIKILVAQRDNWKADAQREMGNSEYWQNRSQEDVDHVVAQRDAVQYALDRMVQIHAQIASELPALALNGEPAVSMPMRIRHMRLRISDLATQLDMACHLAEMWVKDELQGTAFYDDKRKQIEDLRKILGVPLSPQVRGESI